MNIESNWDRLSSTVHRAEEKLGRMNIALAEAFYTNYETTEVSIRNSEILTQDRLQDSGVGFRVVLHGNKIGFACTNSLNERNISETASKAFSIANAGPKTPMFALPDSQKPTSVYGLYDSRVEEMSLEDSVEIAAQAIEAAERVDNRVTVKDGRVIFTYGHRGILNTIGVDREERETRAVIYLAASGKHNDEVTSICYAFDFTRRANLQPQQIGEKAARRAIAMFEPKAIRTFNGPVIFGPEAVSNQLFDVLIDALSADNVRSGHSAWSEKLGQSVASGNLTVIDDAILEGGFGSRSFDDEGCPSKKTCLIQDGKLESLLHHATSAKSLGAENTGNASRSSGELDIVGMIAGRGYKTQPEIYPSNLMIQPGTETRNDMVEDMKQGVLIDSMAGFAQKGSGVISAQLSRAFHVENGEIQFPIKGSMVMGVGFDWLKKISSVSRETERFQNAILPCLQVEDVKVVGS